MDARGGDPVTGPTPPEWAIKEAEAMDLPYAMPCPGADLDIARALATAYARGLEDAARACLDIGALCVIGSEAAIAVETCIHVIRIKAAP